MSKTKEEYDWDLTSIFKNEEERLKAIKDFEKYIEEIKSFQGKLNCLENVKKYYEVKVKACKLHIKIYAMAMFKFHQNMGDNENSVAYKDAVSLGAKYAENISYAVPEIIENSKEDLEAWANNPEMKEYKRSLERIIKDKEHVLSKESEELLASYSEVFGAVESAYDIFTTTDFEFDDVEDEKNEKLKMSHGLYSKYLAGRDRILRKNAFEAMYKPYKKNINTITELYLARVKDIVITARVRKYKNAIDMASQNDDSKEEVYYTLIDAVNENLNLNHEYLDLKSKVLANEINCEKMHMYDVYRNPFEEKEENVNYEEAKQIVLNALSIMGEDYISKIKEAMDNGWIDVYEKENKRSGAYSMGVYGVHPYVLLNFVNSSRDISTIAHELGHAMHSHFADNTQNILNSDYTIMVAEVASTVNEILLANYQIKNTENKTKKAFLINEQLDMIRATLYRQTMFAEFEQIVHKEIENHKNLSSDELNEIYYNLVKKYFGDTTICDDYIKYEWARIPHFYSNFYVYKYATGITSAIVIAKNIMDRKPGFVEKYLNMLSKGGVEDSLDLLKSVGVDLTKKETYDVAFNYFKENLESLKKLI